MLNEAQRKDAAIRFYYKFWYKIVGLISTALLIGSSIGFADGKIIVGIPPMLFTGAIFGAFVAAMYTVPYVRIADGRLQVFKFLRKQDVACGDIDHVVSEQGGRITVHMKDGKKFYLMVFHIDEKERDTMRAMLSKMGTQAEEGKQ